MLHLKTVPVLVALIFCLSPLSATQRSSQPQADNGFSAERLARIDRLLQQYVDENRIAGAVGARAARRPAGLRAGRRLERQGSRTADDRRHDLPHRVADRRRSPAPPSWRSMEEGTTRAHDPVSRSFPAFAKTTVAVRRRIRRGDRPGAAADHDSRSADAHRGHLVRHGRDGGGAVRSEGPRAGRRHSAGTPPTRTSPSATRWSGWRRCRSSRSPARRTSTATTPTSSAASSSARPGMPLDQFIARAHHRRRSA